MQDLSNNDYGHFEAFAAAQYYVRKNYILTEWCRKIDGSHSQLPWHLLTPNLNCAKYNARSKHLEPHLGSSLQAGVLHCSAIISLSTVVFLCQAPSAEWNSLSVCAIQ